MKIYYIKDKDEMNVCCTGLFCSIYPLLHVPRCNICFVGKYLEYTGRTISANFVNHPLLLAQEFEI